MGQSARARTSRAGGHHHPRRGDPSQRLGDAIVSFAEAQQGREVGNGECFSLADHALLNAGAKSAAAYTEVTQDGDYVWGKPVRLADVRPGDILQFRGYSIRKRITTTMQAADGSFSRAQSEEVEERDHHTAIVEQNLGNAVAVLEQNVEPAGRVVQRNRVEIAAHTENTSNPEDLAQTITTEIDVDGEVRAFRPQLAAPVLRADAAGGGQGVQ